MKQALEGEFPKLLRLYVDLSKRLIAAHNKAAVENIPNDLSTESSKQPYQLEYVHSYFQLTLVMLFVIWDDFGGSVFFCYPGESLLLSSRMPTYLVQCQDYWIL